MAWPRSQFRQLAGSIAIVALWVGALEGAPVRADPGYGTGAAVVPASEPPGVAEPASASELAQTENLALLVLDIERRWLGETFTLSSGEFASVSASERLLETLLITAEKRIRAVGWRDHRRPPATLLAIASVLAEAGIRYDDHGSRPVACAGGGSLGGGGPVGRPLSQGLAEGRFDCAMYVWFYLGVAERLGLPLVAISVPGHVALRWLDSDGGHFNWEATVPDLRDDAFYLAWKQPATEAVQQGVYLRSLDRREVAAIAYYRTSRHLAARGDRQTALAAVARALELAPAFPDAHNLQGLILAQRGAIVTALHHFDRAIALDPAFTQAYLNRANTRLEQSDFAGVRADLARWRALERRSQDRDAPAPGALPDQHQTLGVRTPAGF